MTRSKIKVSGVSNVRKWPISKLVSATITVLTALFLERCLLLSQCACNQKINSDFILQDNISIPSRKLQIAMISLEWVTHLINFVFNSRCLLSAVVEHIAYWILHFIHCHLMKCFIFSTFANVLAVLLLTENIKK